MAVVKILMSADSNVSLTNNYKTVIPVLKVRILNQTFLNVFLSSFG